MPRTTLTMQQRAAAGLLGGCVAACLVAALLVDVIALPIVDPGLFVILGVRTCGAGGGYCLLGTDCTLDRDFAADEEGGHCEGLRFAFTPAAHFSCCKYVERSNTTLPGEPADLTTTQDPGVPAATTPAGEDDTENVIETEIKVKPEQDVVVPAGPASGQTLVAVSEEYKVKGGHDEVPVEEAEEQAEVVAVAGGQKEAVLVSPACSNSSGEVNPCWRSSFVDRRGDTLCSGTLMGVDAAVTTAVCANRLLEAGMSAVIMRLGELSLPVRDIAVHQDYQGASQQHNDIAVVRLYLVGASSEDDPPSISRGPAPSCIACMPPTNMELMGKTCFALAARLNGLGVETSAVCAGRVAALQGSQLRLSGCEVASLKSPIAEGQLHAVRAREGAALLCDGALVGLASTSVGAYSLLASQRDWLSRTLAAPRTSTFVL